jgi:uncharacterized membrane protein
VLVSKWAPLALVLIGVAGVAISIYLTIVHYTPVPLVCSTSGLVNCERVLSSPYSSVAGIPISAGGLIWFAVSGALGALALGTNGEPVWLQPAQVIWSLLGLAMVLYLVGVEVLALGVICAWCTALHVLILATLALSLLRSPIPKPALLAGPTPGARR